jgi:hypothetical protein
MAVTTLPPPGVVSFYKLPDVIRFGVTFCHDQFRLNLQRQMLI